MRRRLDARVERSYGHDAARRPLRSARAATVAGALLTGALGRRSRAAAVAGGLALCAGSALTRWAIFQAGVASAGDPEQTVGPQRDRLAATGGG